jgi:putative SOS response-associated peptidase YedK
MCGRFTLHHHAARLAERFRIEYLAFSPEARYNIAPGEVVGAVINVKGAYRLEGFKWGLIPRGNRDSKNPLINARIESLGQQRVLKESFGARRCLIPADGYYEWRGRKNPFYFRRRDHGLFAFAGIWDETADPSDPLIGPVRTLTIVTTEADQLVSPIHGRMPVIIEQQKGREWLDTSITDPADLKRLAEVDWSDLFERYPVSVLVNRTGSDSPEMIREAEPEMTLFGLL